MKKFIIIICSLLMTFCTSFNMIANEPENQPQENEIVSIENNISEEEDVTPENESSMEEISEQQEKAQERLVLILIIIGMVISLGTLYTLKYISYKKENNK